MKDEQVLHLIDPLFSFRTDYNGVLTTGAPTKSMLMPIIEIINKDELA